MATGTPKQHNKIAQPKADKCPTSHFSPFNCCLSVVLQLETGDHPENSHGVFLLLLFLKYIYMFKKNSFVVVVDLLCVWIMLTILLNASCLRRSVGGDQNPRWWGKR